MNDFIIFFLLPINLYFYEITLIINYIIDMSEYDSRLVAHMKMR